MNTGYFRRNAPAFRQRGVAAIEFAFIFAVMLLLAYGIATLGALLYIQQVVSRAAEDGARAAAMLPSKLVVDDPRIQAAVYDSLAAALVVPAESSGSLANRLTWIKANTKVSVDTSGSNGRATVFVVYDYTAHRVLLSVPALDVSLGLPANLVGQATAVQAFEGPST
jgi:Flp pilus assembly protein TadG